MSSIKEKAFELVEELFKDTVDKGGNAYINHLTRVASNLKGDKDKTIALLHDVIEDTDLTKDDLIGIGFSKEIVDAVVILSRKDNETYAEFINRIADSKNSSAIKVKLADLEDNMELNRISKPTSEDIKRVEKRYKPAHAMLTEVLNNL